MSKLKAVFFDLDDTLYTSFQAGDRRAYECLEAWAQQTFGEAGRGFDAAFLAARKQLAAEQPDMPPIHDRVLFAQRALENMGFNPIPHARKAAAIYWDAVFSQMTVRPGAPEFLDELRKDCQVIILSDTFEQFAKPLMAKLGWPTLFCNSLEVAEDGTITGYRMRCEKSKLTTVKALQSIGFETIASGDSYNDLGMIQASKAGFLFRSTEQIRKDHPELAAYEEFDDLLAAIRTAL